MPSLLASLWATPGQPQLSVTGYDYSQMRPEEASRGKLLSPARRRASLSRCDCCCLLPPLGRRRVGVVAQSFGVGRQV
jgi:hypothetical protein